MFHPASLARHKKNACNQEKEEDIGHETFDPMFGVGEELIIGAEIDFAEEIIVGAGNEFFQNEYYNTEIY